MFSLCLQVSTGATQSASLQGVHRQGGAAIARACVLQNRDRPGRHTSTVSQQPEGGPVPHCHELPILSDRTAAKPAFLQCTGTQILFMSNFRCVTRISQQSLNTGQPVAARGSVPILPLWMMVKVSDSVSCCNADWNRANNCNHTEHCADSKHSGEKYISCT